MQIHLKKGEKLYVNGAVIRADQRCSLEFLNNVTFLLENHVMQADKADTPLKQILIDPDNAQITRELYWHLSACLQGTLDNAELKKGLVDSDSCIKSQRHFDALKTLRGLFRIEEKLLSAKPADNQEIDIQKEVA
jgi:flagellar protein FlbT